jgi:hypothetical protein
MLGRTIRLYLVDGTPTGPLTAEIINWTGKVLVAPRSQLADTAGREEMGKTGVYFLVGPDPEKPGRDRLYIGEADSVKSRLAHHGRDQAKDFWERTIIVVSKDENLTKAHARYLESRLIELAAQAGRAVLANGTAPPRPPLPEADIADMEYFRSQVEMVLPVLGFNFLQSAPTLSEITASATTGESPLFVLSGPSAKAEAREIDGEFVVLKGSTARRHGVPSWTTGKSLRDQLVDEGKLVVGTDPETLVFKENVAFTSPSAAASVVLARNMNGRLEWRAESSGVTYAEWQDARLRAAGLVEAD